jgi:hypothetical protein
MGTCHNQFANEGIRFVGHFEQIVNQVLGRLFIDAKQIAQPLFGLLNCRAQGKPPIVLSQGGILLHWQNGNLIDEETTKAYEYLRRFCVEVLENYSCLFRRLVYWIGLNCFGL